MQQRRIQFTLLTQKEKMCNFVMDYSEAHLESLYRSKKESLPQTQGIHLQLALFDWYSSDTDDIPASFLHDTQVLIL